MHMANACTGTTVLSFPTPILSMNEAFSLPRWRWIALLSIAHRYEFMDARARAIREIYDPIGKRDKARSGSNLDPDSEPPDYLTLISIAEEYDVPLHQALPCFVELVMRKEPLTEVEIADSSPLTVHRLARAREEFLCNPERPFDSRKIAKHNRMGHYIWSVGKKMMV